MPTGKPIRLVHLSQQRYLPNSRLVPDHNDKGYGIIEVAEGREVYFSHAWLKTDSASMISARASNSNTRWKTRLTCARPRFAWPRLLQSTYCVPRHSPKRWG